MSVEPALTVAAPHGDVRAVALLLHGGREASTSAVRPLHLAVVRMAPFASALRRAGARHGLAVARLRYLVRGWNGDERSPVADVRWALGRIAVRYPDVPIALVGHSMGGRAAVYAADHPAVRAVVALAPWLEPGDPHAHVAGRHVFVAHGDRDRITSPAKSAAWVERARAVAASAAFLSIRDERHAMLRRAGLWHALTTGYVLAVLCATPPAMSVGPRAAGVVQEALAGQTSFVV